MRRGRRRREERREGQGDGKGCAGGCDDAGRGERGRAAHCVQRHCGDHHRGGDGYAGRATGDGRQSRRRIANWRLLLPRRRRTQSRRRGCRTLLTSRRTRRRRTGRLRFSTTAGRGLDGVAAYGIAGAEARGDRHGHSTCPRRPTRWWITPVPLLDVSDLVFIDMPGTGFGRLLGKEPEKAFWGMDQDANAFARFIVRFTRSTTGGIRRSTFLGRATERRGRRCWRTYLKTARAWISTA